MNPGALKLIFISLFLLLSLSIKAQPTEGYSVEINILDKITSKVKTLNININESKKFESLNIEVYICYKKPPEEVPEDFVLLKIYDEKNTDKNKMIYQGWMISSSPATTPLEHPIYDLWLKDCKIDKDLSN